MKTHNIKSKIYSLIGIFVFVVIAFASFDDKSSNTKKERENKPQIPIMSESEYLKYFQDKWDSIKLYKSEGFPQYKTYLSDLDTVMSDMVKVLEKDPKFTFNSTSDLNKLRLKFNSSKKEKDARYGFFTYGQPLGKFELEDACKNYLEKVLNDPKSFSEVEFTMSGQSKNGWIVVMTYRAKNGFGGLILQTTTFEIRFKFPELYYYVASAY